MGGLQFFGGSPIFLGGSPFFRGVSKFLGGGGGGLHFLGVSNFFGGLQFFGGRGSPIFRGDSNFSGGGGGLQFFGGSPIFLGVSNFSGYDQRSAGTHPTGMHSCQSIFQDREIREIKIGYLPSMKPYVIQAKGANIALAKTSVTKKQPR